MSRAIDPLATARNSPIYIGFSANEIVACNVARQSILQRASYYPTTKQISRRSLWQHYQRPTELRNGQLWDVISDAPMSTDHAIARFFVPWLCDYQGWAVFVDGDVLVRRDLVELFALANPDKAVMCVQHPPLFAEGTKKEGDPQLAYPRKNWSSVMLFNCAHPANHELAPELLNRETGRWLHNFSWLKDSEIGWLPAEWNYLVSVNLPHPDPAIVHYTLGLPTVPGHEADPFADEWFNTAGRAGYQLDRPRQLAQAG